MAVVAAPFQGLHEVSRPAQARRFYAPELDVLRFFAFSVVFARHVVTGFGIAKARATAVTGSVGAGIGSHAAASGHWQSLQGFAQCLDFGVCLFFFLSSFLITTLLLLEWRSTGKVDVKGFYIRRALRIWPLYYVFLLVMGLLAAWQPWMNISGPRMWASLLLVANWPIVLHGWAGSPIELLWSVSVEEQFYALWPQFARFGPKTILVTSILLGIAPFAAIAWLGSKQHPENTMFWANSLVQCLFFSAGAIVALMLKGRPVELGRAPRVCLFAGGWICWLSASGFFHVVRTASPGVMQLTCGYSLILAGTILLFAGFYGWRPKRFPTGLAYLGKISYGLYVLHFFWLELVTRLIEHWSEERSFAQGTSGMILTHSLIAVIAFAITAASASLSYRFLESPFLRLKSRFTIVASRPA